MKKSAANGKVLGSLGFLLFLLFFSPALSVFTYNPASAAESPVFCGEEVGETMEDIELFSNELLTAFEQWTSCGKYDVDCLRGKGSTRADKKRRLDTLFELIKYADKLIALGPGFYDTAYILLDTVYQRCDGIGPNDEYHALADWVRGPAQSELVCALELLKEALLNFEPVPKE